jgi:DNA-binding transcriptional LysR family regulator
MFEGAYLVRYDLNLLPIFVALIEERSVTRAAERVGMTQPALSNALGRLRLMLRDQLFVRQRYGIEPTPIALELAPVIADALARLDDAVLGQQDFDPSTAEQRIVNQRCTDLRCHCCST